MSWLRRSWPTLVLPMLLLLFSACSQLRGPIADLGDVARGGDRDLAALELAYSIAQAQAENEAERQEIDRAFDPAFVAHRAFIRAYERAERTLRHAIALVNAGDQPDMPGILQVVADVRAAYEAFVAAKEETLALRRAAGEP